MQGRDQRREKGIGKIKRGPHVSRCRVGYKCMFNSPFLFWIMCGLTWNRSSLKSETFLFCLPIPSIFFLFIFFFKIFFLILYVLYSPPLPQSSSSQTSLVYEHTYFFFFFKGIKEELMCNRKAYDVWAMRSMGMCRKQTRALLVYSVNSHWSAVACGE